MNCNRVFKSLRASMIGGAILIGTAVPSFAQSSPEADIDALIDSSSTTAGALTLAHNQAGDGNLLGAAATLEGALLAESGPEAADVRIYYVTILCRLDDRQRAGIELAKIDGSTLSDPAWAEVQQACGNLPRPAAINSGDKTNRIAIEVAAGIAYNSDAFGAVANQFDIPGFTFSDDGFSFIASARIDGRAAIGDDNQIYYGLSALTNNSFSGPDLDYQFGTARLGYAHQEDRLGMSIGGVVRHGRIAGDPFVTEYGGQAELTARIAETGRVALRGEIVKQDYNFSLPPLSRDGERYDLALEYRGQPSSGTSYVFGAAYESKDAFSRFLGYRGVRGYAAIRTPLTENGTYAGLSAVVRHVNYRDDPAFFFIPDRIETRYFARGAIGLPIGDTGLAVEAAASYTRRDYNAASLLRDYDSVGAELRLIYTFGN